uniref:molybdate ABC transporter permease subunit n=1 Tax=Ndongobacter massiliensis TaxID=1871025 RepID=UPI000931796E|nr:molybdate ABC transporter permease subunit [Ndongobacter massiliensis]
MDLFPLYNSLRISLLSTFFTFFLGIFAAYEIKKLRPIAKGFLDVLLTLPLVLPPTVVGFFLLKWLGPNSGIGKFFEGMNVSLIMRWYSSIFATIVVTFPLMYRTARGAFEAFDSNLKYAGQTLGKNNTWIFWKIIMPNCKKEILAGVILSFARALGEYGATSMVSGYIPNRTATISTTVYQLWRIGEDSLAYQWVLINVGISFFVLLAINLLESKGAKNARV